MRSRGQLTLYVAIGLVVLIMFSFVFLLLRPHVSNPSVSNYPVLNNYLGSCLDLLMNEEMEKVGYSGGLSVMEYSAFPHATVESGGIERDVIYGVTTNRRSPPDELAPYPSEHRPADCVTSPSSCLPFSDFQSGYFGDMQFPATCDRTNNLTCRYYPGSPPGTPRGTPGKTSVQEGLVTRIEQRMPSCANLDQFSKALGTTVLAVGEPKVNLTFTKSNIIVSLSYNLSLEQGQTVLPLVRSYPIRFLPISEYAYDLAREITTNPAFNPSTQYANRTLLDTYNGFSVERKTVNLTTPPSGFPTSVPLASISNSADLITITDDRSTLRGEPFHFSFLVEHRPLVLLGADDTCSQLEFYDLNLPTLKSTPIVSPDPSSCQQAIARVTPVPADWQEYCTPCVIPGP